MKVRTEVTHFDMKTKYQELIKTYEMNGNGTGLVRIKILSHSGE